MINKFIIKFGDQKSALDLEKNNQKIIIKNIGETIFLKQTHSSDGIILENNIDSFAKEGDFIFTKTLNLAIGVFTADCLSIIIIDPKEREPLAHRCNPNDDSTLHDPFLLVVAAIKVKK